MSVLIIFTSGPAGALDGTARASTTAVPACAVPFGAAPLVKTLEEER